MDVSDRSLQAMLTQEAKITSASFPSEVIFAFGGFINGLTASLTVSEKRLFLVHRERQVRSWDLRASISRFIARTRWRMFRYCESQISA